MRTTFAALTVVLLLALPAATAAVPPGQPAGGADDGAVGETAAAASADAVAPTARQLAGTDYIEIDLRADGDAVVAFGLTLPASNDSERRAFQRTAESFEAGEHDLGYETVRDLVPRVRNATGREMAVGEPTHEASINDGTGRLEQRFTWSGFAAVDGETLSVADAFRDGDGLWLRWLYEDQRLQLRSPEEYRVARSPSGPEIDDGALVWTGPRTFSPSDFQVTFEPDPGGSGSDGLGVGVAAVAAGLLLVLVLVVLGSAVLARRRDGRPLGAIVAGLLPGGAEDEEEGDEDEHDAPAQEEAPAGGTTTDEGGDEPAPGGASDSPAGSAATEGAADADEPAEPATETPPTPGEAPTAGGEPANTGRDGPGGTATADAGAQPTGETVDPDLLSDEERVRRLLEANGGRMKQANIVTETGWSNAKVSQLLSGMDEDGEIDKLRIGRENLISLPDVDVTDGGSDESE